MWGTIIRTKMHHRNARGYGLLHVWFQHFHHHPHWTFRGPSYCKFVVQRHIGEEFMLFQRVFLKLARWKLFASHINPSATPPCGVIIRYPSIILSPPFSILTFVHLQFFHQFPRFAVCLNQFRSWWQCIWVGTVSCLYWPTSGDFCYPHCHISSFQLFSSASSNRWDRPSHTSSSSSDCHRAARFHRGAGCS